MNPRFYKRESRTLELMIGIYCRAHHGLVRGLCTECAALKEYALKRLAACRYGDEKPNCSRCPVHCYRQDMRSRMAAVMRFSGPRMLRRHPLAAILHLIRGRKKPPPSGA